MTPETVTPLPADHHAREVHQIPGGWRVICGCDKPFDRETRDDALSAHEGHWNVMRVRAEMKRGDE